MIYKLGVFDSGVGGLTVVKEIEKIIPDTEIMYFADSEHFPYGEKTQEQIIGYCRDIVKNFVDQGAQAIVIACNTATAQALDTLLDEFNLPIIGVVRPGARMAVESTRNGRIGILATNGTCNTGVYPREIHKLMPEASVIQVGAPKLVEAVERGIKDGPEMDKVLAEYLPAFAGNVDTLVMACTHFPHAEESIKKALPGVTLVNPGVETAVELKRVLDNI